MWLDMTVWGKNAENSNQYLSKGDEIMVSGYLTEDAWEDENTGQRRRKKKMVATFIKFGRKAGGGEQAQREERSDGPSERAEPSPEPSSVDDYPF
jgi:single-strand DNA-binding protein